MTAIGAKIKFYREALDWTQAELGSKLAPPVKPDRVHQIENSISLKGETVDRYAKALGVSPDVIKKPIPFWKRLNPFLVALVFALWVAGLAIYHAIDQRDILPQEPPSQKFLDLHVLYPRPWEKLSSWNCFNKLSASDQALVPAALTNYKSKVLAQRKKWGGAVPAWKNDSTFFCRGVWRNFIKK